ncbi:uncharacterized protein LOC123295728 isoform X2 [Chrysoperla carnea]|uniref:uncharacterized protein LOC123295728 isoform X2 n=1 Tax=Chrysoperla carnea TaxID=189513 RepID=UPI001D0672AE|nr:uncharacterized protein LOC123295728 isoform X2 [Chrysoperla carnea]
MLGVLKRRWKPKRASNGNRLSADNVNCSVPGDIILEKPRVTPSPRQVHPVCEEKAQLLAYENTKKPNNSRDTNSIHPPTTLTPLVMPMTQQHTSTMQYPLTPNICVEGGRIEFIKTSPDVDNVSSQQHQMNRLTTPPSPTLPPRYTAAASPPTPIAHRRRSTVTCETIAIQEKPETVSRSQQTTDFIEKYDIEKECLEQRIMDLELALEQEHKANQKDKVAIAKLQRQLSRRESVQRDAERERKLRAESEVRMREAGAEATRYRTRLKFLTQEFAKMEESVRAMLAYKSRAEQLKQEKASLTLAFEARSQHYQATIARLSQEVSTLRQQLESVSGSPENCIAALEADNATLQRQVQEARNQYERCLDDVANQVVRALLSQKTLREEIVSLTRRIRELETQNRALTSLLVQQLRTGSTPSSAMITPNSAGEQLALDGDIHDLTNSALSSPGSLFHSPPEERISSNLKHSNSFNFQQNRNIDKRFSTGDLISSYNEKVLPSGELVACISEKRLSANVLDSCEDNGLSLEDKKRHQVLADLWKDLQGSEVTPQKLLNALSALESNLWTTTGLPAKRPATLNLTLPQNLQQSSCNRSINKKIRPIVGTLVNKPEEELGSESPESGNRDEGYSTMSSDVQGEVNRSQSEPNRGLEDLAEVTDETADTQSEKRFIVVDVQDRTESDILYIPINLALRINPRNSYPPTKDLLPFQHVMRSFSDSHLCIKITTAPSPCYSISSPITSTPSVLLLDVNPLRRTRGNASLAPVDSWGSNLDLEPTNQHWDSEYIQHWLKLDETRSNLQQQHRDLLELEYDRAELEDWSLSLSAEDVRDTQITEPIQTPGQVSIATLPSIQEGSTVELEEDSSECLWNDSSYLADRTGGELVSLLMDTETGREIEVSWPYAASHDVSSPPESWSSVSEDDPCSKRSSAAMSGCSDDAPVIGTNFTRDFYRLVKFESTKSLASCSSRGTGQQEHQFDREQTLQSVLSFIAEQQMYCNNQEHRDSRPSSARDFNIEGPPQSRLEEVIWTDSCTSTEPLSSEIESQHTDEIYKNENYSDSENYVSFQHLRNELALNEQNTLKDLQIPDCIVNAVFKDDKMNSEQSQNSSTEIKSSKPFNKSNGVSLDIHIIEKQNSGNLKISSEINNIITPPDLVNGENSTRVNSSLITVPEEEETSPPTTLTESFTSSVSTPDTIVSRIPRRSKIPKSNIPINCNKSPPIKEPESSSLSTKTTETTKKPVKSRIPYKHKSTVVQIVKKEAEKKVQPVITSERLPQFASSGIPACSVIEGPPERAVSFHERATSKDVIDELNRMIRKSDDGTNVAESTDEKISSKKLDSCCYATGWVHVEKDIDFNDPKARANLLDVMLASSDSSPTSSCGGSVSSESNDDRSDYKHLHKIHRYRRQKKESNSAPCTPSTETAV